MAKPLGRILRLQDARRAPVHRGLRHPPRSTSPGGRLANRVQQHPSPLRTGDAHTHLLRPSLADRPNPTHLTDLQPGSGYFRRCPPPEDLAWSGVDLVGDGFEGVAAPSRKGGAFWEVLA